MHIGLLLLLSFLFSDKVPERLSITVMSYNIHHGADQNERNTLDSMGHFIRSSGADIIGLQEVDSFCERTGKVHQMQHLADISGLHAAFVRHFAFQGGAYGQGLLSRYPIRSIENIRLSLLKPDSLRQSLALIVGEIELPGNKRILVANAHFSLDSDTRMVQAQEVLSYLEQRKMPAIFMGDLNALPEAPEIQMLCKKMTIISSRSVPTFSATQPTKTIDYIFSNRLLKIRNAHAKVIPVLYSDHLPVNVSFELE